MSLAGHLLSQYQLKIKEVRLIPTYLSGAFEIWINDELVHSRRLTGQFPADQEIDAAVDVRL